MSKVGIITFYKKNYGAFLQAYALQKIIKEIGHEPEAIQYDFTSKKTFIDFIREPSYFLKKILADYISKKETDKKINIFKKSIKKYLHESEKRFGNIYELSQCVHEYDVFITGSDQVWNPKITPNNLHVRLLEFVPDTKRIASYAASISAKKVTEKERELIRNGINRFDYISVREETTKKVIGEIPGKNIVKNVDPCLLLNSIEWNEIIENPEEKDYLLVYKLMAQPDMFEHIKKIADENKLTVVSLGKLEGYKYNYVCVPYTSPEKFLGYIKYAEYVITNSFHGVVFSIIFKKRANFFLPASSHDRALELIKSTKTDRLLEKVNIMNNELIHIYEYVDDYLLNERKKSISYLNEVCGKA